MIPKSKKVQTRRIEIYGSTVWCTLELRFEQRVAMCTGQNEYDGGAYEQNEESSARKCTMMRPYDDSDDELRAMLLLDVESRQERDSKGITVEEDRLELEQSRLSLYNERFAKMFGHTESMIEIEQHLLDLDAALRRGAAE